MQKRLNFTFIAATIFLLSSNSLTLAEDKKTQPPDKFPPNPIEITTPDPLLPRKPKKKQPLTPEELQKLAVALDDLNQQATAKFQAGDKLGAYELWNRELRLRRYLGDLSEVQALSRVGGIAYSDNNRLQVQYVSQRLLTVQKQAQKQKTLNLELLQAFGQAYQQVRSPKQAVEAYQQVLALVRQKQDTNSEISTLQSIGSIHLSWFEYPQAAAIYEELLNLTTKTGDRAAQVTYLKELAYIYTQSRQPDKSVNVRNKLAEYYLQDNNVTELLSVKMEIAADYQVLSKQNPELLQQAFKNYEEVYQKAWELQQYGRASEALEEIITLYRSQGQIKEALSVSQIMLQLQQQAANFYGQMKAYDQIGQLQVEQKDYPQALAAFKRGLEIAQDLNYDLSYFQKQIESVGKQMN